MKTVDNITALKEVYLPLILRLSKESDKKIFDTLIGENQVFYYHDEILGQLEEFIKSQNPSIKIKPAEYPKLVKEHLNGTDIAQYGVWVYYPWSHRMVHLLDEDEFVEVRTNRNRYKITREEQAILQSKIIGIAGLSVGQSIALTMAIERTCGELRLADFDTAELSNLNRLRTSVANLGLRKTVIAAREIAEIDPFLKVRIFNDGLTAENMDKFFLEDGKLDLFVEVCDGLDIKIQGRLKAKSLQIPVIMDTNDKGMLDVERFDLEPERPILHGLIQGLRSDNIKGLSNEEKIPYMLRMIGADTMSTRLKASMMEVEQSINTWPQLASSVTLGGALTTDVSRRILLNQFKDSGRYYVDLDDLVKEAPVPGVDAPAVSNPYVSLEKVQMDEQVKQYFEAFPAPNFKLTDEVLDKLIEAALAAPSAGNNQPWKWTYNNGALFLFHDKFRSWSWGDYDEMGSHMALGAALENVHLQSASLNLQDICELFPLKDKPCLIAVIRFNETANADPLEVELAKDMFSRRTNRKLAQRQLLKQDFYLELSAFVNKTDFDILYTENEAELAELADIIAECDKLRLLNKLGHEEFYHEIRWDEEETQSKKDGVDISSVDITMSEFAGFKIAKDWRAVSLISDLDLGDAFKKLSTKGVQAASGMVLFTISDFNHSMLVNVGRIVQRAWIFANQKGVSIHPMLSPAFFFSRLVHGEAVGLTSREAAKLTNLRERFLKVFPGKSPVFLMKLAIADDMPGKSLRKDKKELFYVQTY